MKPFSFKKRDLKYILVLLLLVILIISSIVETMEDTEAYYEHMQNAVTVTATVGDSFQHFRKEVDWYSGAGDDVEKEVSMVPYYTYQISYTFEGKEYTCTDGGYNHTTAMRKGMQTEVVIDAENPEQLLTIRDLSKPDFDIVWIYLCIFFLILLIWLIRKFKVHK